MSCKTDAERANDARKATIVDGIGAILSRCNKDVPWIVVNSKHIVIDAILCRYLGKHIDEISE